MPTKEQNQVGEFSICMDQQQDYEFRVGFDKSDYQPLILDEPRPLGHDQGPNAERILAAAVGNCLSASLLFCARKARLNVKGIHTNVAVEIVRNERGRLRIRKMRVEIIPALEAAEEGATQRCLELFEDYCVVTQSVREGIDIDVSVKGW